MTVLLLTSETPHELYRMHTSLRMPFDRASSGDDSGAGISDFKMAFSIVSPGNHGDRLPIASSSQREGRERVPLHRRWHSASSSSIALGSSFLRCCVLSPCVCVCVSHGMVTAECMKSAPNGVRRLLSSSRHVGVLSPTSHASLWGNDGWIHGVGD